MPVNSGKPQTRRNLVSLRREEYELAKRLAANRGVSLSQVIGDALRAVDTKTTTNDPLTHLIGKLEEADPQDSECHDEIIYGSDIH